MRGSTKVFTFPEAVVDKLFGAKKGYMGFAGNADVWGDVVTWLTTLEGKPPKCRDIEFLAITELGLYHATTLTNWFEVTESHFAIGSGCPYAITAMDAGKDPLEAVKLASKRDVSTGMGYKHYIL